MCTIDKQLHYGRLSGFPQLSIENANNIGCENGEDNRKKNQKNAFAVTFSIGVRAKRCRAKPVSSVTNKKKIPLHFYTNRNNNYPTKSLFRDRYDRGIPLKVHKFRLQNPSVSRQNAIVKRNASHSVLNCKVRYPIALLVYDKEYETIRFIEFGTRRL